MFWLQLQRWACCKVFLYHQFVLELIFIARSVCVVNIIGKLGMVSGLLVLSCNILNCRLLAGTKRGNRRKYEFYNRSDNTGIVMWVKSCFNDFIHNFYCNILWKTLTLIAVLDLLSIYRFMYALCIYVLGFLHCNDLKNFVICSDQWDLTCSLFNQSGAKWERIRWNIFSYYLQTW